jgi:zinc-finger of transposase IS204/IS1001/IS1096/IS1165
MGCVDTHVLSSVFLLPETLAIDGVYPTKTHLTIQVRCVLKSASCPLCQHPSERIHGSYGRTVADVPCGGRRVTLALTVGKFVQAEAYPERHASKEGARRSRLNPYKGYLLHRWQQGCEIQRATL